MKKTLKIFGITLLIFAALLIAIPYIFEGQIKDMVKAYLNDNINARVDFEDVNLSLLSSFPKASVTVDNLIITNYKPFENEQLAKVKSISFDMSVKELFKRSKDGSITVNTIVIDEAYITTKTNKSGNSNYDIFKGDNKTISEDKPQGGFAFNIESYQINNSSVIYVDEASKTLLSLTEIYHSGKGMFTADTSELDTQSEANISFSMDSVKYLNSNHVKLDALIDMNLNENKYTFKENNGFINQLPIEFDGFVKLLENGQDIDISFKNTGSDFKDFFAIIPEQYSKKFKDIKTSGIFKIDGTLNGMITDTTIPKLNINIASNKASFQYPSLPKSVENIVIDIKIINETGSLDDTYITIDNLAFQIDQDVFQSSAKIQNLNKNIIVDANLDGTLNLTNISKAYPVELENEFSGIIKTKLKTNFDMNAVETNAFDRIRSIGNINVINFVFTPESLPNTISISKASIDFKPGTVSLKTFDATVGKSDLKATGTINNLLGFLLSDKNLKGNFNVSSNLFQISDFMVETKDELEEKNASENLKIPAFLDCTINANAQTVLYDNLKLKNVAGTLVIKDEKAELKNLSSSIFDGNLTINGNVDTQQSTPNFDMKLGIDKFNISQSFNDLQLLQSLAPIARALQGKLDGTIELSGKLTKDFTPELGTISGNASAELINTKIEPKNEALFNKLKGSLNFVDFDKLDLNDVKAQLTFKEGKVNVKPFNLNYKDINIVVDGSHGFDKSMNYKAVFNVPAKYLGTDVNNLISKIDAESAKDITIPVTANIGGSLTQPTVSTDLTSSVSNLTQKLLEIEKTKLINKGKNQVNDVLGGVLGNNKNETDSTKSNTTNPVKTILDGILGGKKKTKDSVN